MYLAFPPLRPFVLILILSLALSVCPSYSIVASPSIHSFVVMSLTVVALPSKSNYGGVLSEHSNVVGHSEFCQGTQI